MRNAFRQHLSMEYNVIEVSEMLSESAMRLAEKHGLRGCDSIQLASALEANSSYLSAGLKGAEFISSDAELNAAALIEGLVVSNPNAHP